MYYPRPCSACRLDSLLIRLIHLIRACSDSVQPVGDAIAAQASPDQLTPQR